MFLTVTLLDTSNENSILVLDILYWDDKGGIYGYISLIRGITIFGACYFEEITNNAIVIPDNIINTLLSAIWILIVVETGENNDNVVMLES